MYIVYSIHAVILTCSLAKNGLENGSTVAVVSAATAETTATADPFIIFLPYYM